MSREAPQGYRYHNPGESDPVFNTFEVVPSVPADGSLVLAEEFQAIKLDALAGAFRIDFTRDQIAQYVNPADHGLVEEETKRVQAASQTALPYMHARLVAPESQPLPKHDGQRVVSFGRIEPAYTNSRWQRIAAVLSPKVQSVEAVDVSNLFVRPGLQGKGFGLATLFSLLDRLPDATPMTVLAPAVNRDARPVLSKLGFTVVHYYQDGQPDHVFGKRMNHTRYDGPNRGELRQILEDRSPWLPYREPVEA
jgi:hypothetical protein